MKRKMETQQVIVLPDMHIPWEDEKTLWAVERFMADHRWDMVINLGDLMDLGCISHWNEGKADTMALQSQFEDDLAMTQLCLERQLAILRKRNPDCKFKYIQGNHCFWAKAMVEKNPSLRKTFDIPLRLGLKEKGIEWIPFWEDHRNIVRIGKANFIHGEYVNEHHAKKTVSAYGCNIYYGHTHDVQEFSLVHRGDDSTLVGKSLGTLCRYDTPYTKGKPNKWQQAFAHFTVYPDGNYTEHTIRIFKHKFEAQGIVYDGANKTVTKL
jgi:hypothetical protein